MQCHSRNDLKAAKQFFEHINTVEPYSIATADLAISNVGKSLKRYKEGAND